MNKIKVKDRYSLHNILLCFIAVFFAGTGIALNSISTLGNDSVALLYDGVRAVFNLGMDKFGLVSNLFNLGLVVIVLFTASKYINIGTVIYTILLGLVISLVSGLYSIMNIPFGLVTKIILALLGCLLLYMGIGLYIAVDIGLDPVTAFEMMLADKFKIQFRTCKVIFDFSAIVVGYLLGGKVGILTFLTAATAGFSIQFFACKFKKILLKCAEKEVAPV